MHGICRAWWVMEASTLKDTVSWPTGSLKPWRFPHNQGQLIRDALE